MVSSRRNFLKTACSAFCLSIVAKFGLIFTRAAEAAWPEKAFHSNKLNDVLLNLFQQNKTTKTKRIKLKIPGIAQDGAVVPLTITSTLRQIDRIVIFVAQNPRPLIADFELSPNMEVFVRTRIRMADTGHVTVIARANGKLYSTQKQVSVAIGGC